MRVQSSVACLGGLDVLPFVIQICPIVVASKSGWYFLRRVFVRPGKVGRYSLSRAFSSVEMLGENREVWWNATRSAGWLELPMTAIAMNGSYTLS